MCEVRTVAIPKTRYRYEVRYVWTVAKLKKISSENLSMLELKWACQIIIIGMGEPNDTALGT